MKVGITGANGFIGSHVLHYLQHKIKPEILEVFDKNKYNLLNFESLKNFVHDKDVIFHLAGKNIANTTDFLNVNALGTINILEAIRKFSSYNPKIIFSSSFHVYGLSKTKKRFKENDRCNPSNMFGLSKKFGEDAILYFNENYGIKNVILRLSNVYGSHCKPYYNSVIATFIDLSSKGLELNIKGDGTQVRNFIYIEDVVESFIKALNFDRNNTEIFNICTSETTSLNELIEILGKIMKKKAKIKYIDRSDMKTYLIGNPNKAERLLGFKTTTNLEEGLIKTLKGS